MFFASFMFSRVHAQDTLYWDKDWNVCDEQVHQFYRPLPLERKGELVLVRDYHKNGQIQMQGYAMADDSSQFVGDVYWYDEYGNDQSFRQFYNFNTPHNLVYYDQKGEVWQEITYGESGKKRQVDFFLHGKHMGTGFIDDRGKKTGVFYLKQYEADYQSSIYEGEPRTPREITNISEEPFITTMAASPVIELQDQDVKAVPVSFSVITYWKSGQVAAEMTYGYDNLGYLDVGFQEKISQKVWNKAGQLISATSFMDGEDASLRQYVEPTYYTSLGLADTEKSLVEMKGFGRNGKTSSFYPNGALWRVEWYSTEGLERVEEYQPDGDVQYTSEYRNSEPFHGQFFASIGQHEKVYFMEHGVIQGFTYLRDPYTGGKWDEGTYEDGQPYDGIVYTTNGFGPMLRGQYKKGVQHGLQQLHENNWRNELVETYHMVDGVREGERVIYELGKPMYHSIYRQGKISSGTVIEQLMEKTYRNGQLQTIKHKATSYDDTYVGIETFVGGQPRTVSYCNFTIADHPQQEYRGVFNDGKPYEGYFINDTILNEIPLIDHYVDGLRVHQYSFDYLSQLDNYHHYTYDIKTAFNTQGVITEGRSYQHIDDKSLLISHYLDGELVQKDIDLFGMHAFDRFTFRMGNDSLCISQLSSPTSLVIHLRDTVFQASIWRDEQEHYTSSLPQPVADKTPNSVTYQYLNQGEIGYYSMQQIDVSYFQLEDRGHLTDYVYPLFPAIADRALSALSDDIIDYLLTDQLADLYQGIALKPVLPFEQSQFLGLIQYDGNASVKYATYITMRENGTAVLTGLRLGQEKYQREFPSLQAYLENKETYLDEASSALLNGDDY